VADQDTYALIAVAQMKFQAQSQPKEQSSMNA
jgi:hypothetical protein